MVAGVIAVDDAQIKSRKSVPTESTRGPGDGLRRITALIEDVIQNSGVSPAQIGGIGIGCTGPVDTVRGLVKNPYTLPNWDNLPLVQHLTAQFKLPTCLLGDCQVAVLGEQWAGAAKGAQNVLYITVGTGIGSGLITNGRLHLGVGFAAGEVGHHVIDLNGPDCYCGAKGCWEMLAAGPAIARCAAERAPAQGKLLELAKEYNGGGISAELVCRAAAEGDAFAADVVNQTAVYLGIGLANLLNILAPEVTVMGGGVMKSWPLFEAKVMETIRSRAAMIPLDQMHIVPARLGLNAGITGAGRAILEHLAGKL